MSLKDFFITDTEFEVGNLRLTAQFVKRPALLQHRLSKKFKVPNYRARFRLIVARRHAKCADCGIDTQQTH